MTIYAVIRKTDQVEVVRFAAASLFEFEGYPFTDYDYSEVVDGALPSVEPARITKFAFRSRFTQDERVMLEIAALDDPTAPMQQRAMAASLRSGQQDIAVAQFVDLNLPETRVGVQALEAAGLLAEGRALTILDTEPTTEERWNG